jgi:hypothetical protein
VALAAVFMARISELVGRWLQRGGGSRCRLLSVFQDAVRVAGRGCGGAHWGQEMSHPDPCKAKIRGRNDIIATTYSEVGFLHQIK